MTVVTAVGNEKGGVGKTTVTLCLASELARLGRRVLLIDLDQQTSAAETVGGSGPATIEDVLAKKDPTPLSEATITSRWEGIDVVPGSDSISSLDRDSDGMAAFRLQQVLEREHDFVRQYDDIMIDLPPAVATATVSGLLAAHRVVAVTEPEPYSSEGLQNFLGLLARIAGGPRPQLRLHGVLVNKVRPGTKEHAYRLTELESALGREVLLEPRIPLRVALAGVASEQLPIHALQTSGAREMSALFALHAEQLVAKSESVVS